MSGTNRLVLSQSMLKNNTKSALDSALENANEVAIKASTKK